MPLRCVVSTGEVLLLTMWFVPGTSKYVDWCVTRPTYVWQQQPDLPLLDLSVLLGCFVRSSSLLAQPGSNYGSTRYRVVPGTAAHAERTRTCWSTEYYDYCRFLLPAPYIGFDCFSLQVLLYSYLALQQQLVPSTTATSASTTATAAVCLLYAIYSTAASPAYMYYCTCWNCCTAVSTAL